MAASPSTENDDATKYLPGFVVLVLFVFVILAAWALPRHQKPEQPTAKTDPQKPEPKKTDPDKKAGEVETLFADAVFAFGKGALDSLNRESQEALSGLATRLKSSSVTRVVVTGHTDRFGSSELNRVLSTERAESIRSYLIAQGIKPDLIQAAGAGSTEPKSKCPATVRREPKVIACLAPDRRVEVRYWTG